MNTDNDDDDSSSSSYQQEANQPKERKTIHPSRFAHILQLRTKDEEANIITVCSIQDFRHSGTFDSDDSFSRNDDYLVSFPDDDSDLYSINTDENNSSMRNSIYSVRSGQELYSLIDAKLAETILDLDKSLEELNKQQFGESSKQMPSKSSEAKCVFEDIFENNSSDVKNNNAKINIPPRDIHNTQTLNKPNITISGSFRDTVTLLETTANIHNSDVLIKEAETIRFDEGKIGEVNERWFNLNEEITKEEDEQCPTVFLKMNRAACIQRALKWSGFKKVIIYILFSNNNELNVHKI